MHDIEGDRTTQVAKIINLVAIGSIYNLNIGYIFSNDIGAIFILGKFG